LNLIQKFEKLKFFSKNPTSNKIKINVGVPQKATWLPGWKNLPLKWPPAS